MVQFPKPNSLRDHTNKKGKSLSSFKELKTSSLQDKKQTSEEGVSTLA